MKRLIAAAVAASALAFAQVPVVAQDYGGDLSAWDDEGDPSSLDQRITWVQDRIDRGREDGTLSRSEGRRVQDALDGIRHDEAHARARHHGHLSDVTRRSLMDRLFSLARHVRWQGRESDENRP